MTNRDTCQDHPHIYNTEHRHGGIGWLTPAMVHYGHVEGVRAARQHVLAAAYVAHPERFVRRPPEPPVVPAAVWINPPPSQAASAPCRSTFGGSTLPRERPSASRIDDLETGHYLHTPHHEGTERNVAALTSAVRQ